MSWWNGSADCPRCGGQGTLLVQGKSNAVEIEGCWVCGFGKKHQQQVEFVRTSRVPIQRTVKKYHLPNN